MSTIGKIFHPLFDVMAGLLAFFYQVVPNYAVAITLLTLTVMLVLAPLTVKSTRSMLAMQRLQPEMKKLQAKYKGDRQKLNEEMMAFYKEHGISPLGGCLPMLLQLPVFFIMYDVIRGLTHIVNGQPSPRYIGHNTVLYHHLVAGGGKMQSFGIDLAKSITSVHGGFLGTLPFIALVALAVVLQYVQMRQMNGRNPQANMNPQAAMMQKVMPIVFVFIYISIPAGVNVYFVVSSLFRIGQQELMYRYDPKLASSVGGSMLDVTVVADESKRRPPTGTSGAPRRGLLAALTERAAASQATRGGSAARTNAKDQVKPRGGVPKADSPARAKDGAGDTGVGEAKAFEDWSRGPSRTTNGNGPANRNGNGNGAANRNGAANGASNRNPDRNAGKKSHPRSQAKKARRAR